MLGRLLDRSYAPEVRRNITTLTAARLTGNACYRYSAPFLATVARGLDVTLDEIGIALAAAELAGLLSPLTARLVDRLGQRRAMAGGLFAVVAGASVVAASQGLVMFAVGLVVLSQSKVLFDLGMGAWIADHVPYERRSRVVGLTETSWAFGLLIGVSAMGVVTSASGWRAAYVVGAAAVAALAVIVAIRIPSGEAHIASGRERPTAGGRLIPGAWLALVAALSLMAASQSLFVTFGGWLEDSFDFTPATLSAVTFALGLGELAASLTSAHRTDRWGKERSTAMGAALMVPGGLLLAVWHDQLAPGLVFLVLAIVGFEFAIVSALAIASRLVVGSPARGLGMMIGAGTLGRAVASIPATRLYERGGIGGPAAMCAGLATVTVVSVLALAAVNGRVQPR